MNLSPSTSTFYASKLLFYFKEQKKEDICYQRVNGEGQVLHNEIANGSWEESNKGEYNFVFCKLS